ncbi:putative sulfate exporter family transporter [Lactococcus raffinolactis]|uniref:YeiH family protein n=1 Tax=Pseudolactococcus raffinolactis TaxID=1366 RepID=UPI0014369B79|nr:putative sulfate exporter family transporter [Lactococcus raffinolactis]QIW61555.1 putative sulfate exporter family transporter [Lactococcus raffinolactis]
MENALLKKYTPLLPGLGLSVSVAVLAKIVAIFLPDLGGATLAILFGIVLGNTFFKQEVLAVGTKFSESVLLEYSVVLLGFTVTFQTISHLGFNGLGYIIAMMATVISATILIGKRLGFSDNMSTMMAGGNAVCGSSAIGAIAPSIGAKDDEKGQVITLVNLLGTVMMLTLPFLGTMLYGKDLLANSALLGGTLQSVGQVVAGASLINPETVSYAMLFKITRIIFLVVVVFVFQQRAQKQGTAQVQHLKKVSVPWYVIAFLSVCILNSCIKLPQFFNDGAHQIGTWFETIALAAIGLRLDFKKFMKEGLSFLTYGLLVGIVQTLAALVLIHLFRIG